MSRLLSTLTSASERPGQKPSTNVFLVQSSAAQSAIPIVRSFIQNARTNNKNVLLLRTLYPLQALEGSTPSSSSSNLKCIDWTSNVPGFGISDINWADRLAEAQRAVDDCDSTRTIAVVVDSVDTLEDDLGSPSKVYNFLSQVLSHLRARNQSFYLVLHITLHSNVLPLLQQPSFAPSITHISAHPPALLSYIASEFLCPPPTDSSSPTDPLTLKFWNVFTPLTQRARAGEVEALVFGQRDRPSGSQIEIVLEVLTRSHSGELSTFGGASATMHAGGSRRRAVDRVLEGWNTAKSEPCKLEDLASLKTVWRRSIVTEQQEAPDPTKNLTFNLSLTESQQNSKSKVPLPYEHEGNVPTPSQQQTSHILYDPDSADDLDDEDPDEDLDI